ncbi:50S ribosomal protein L28 [Kutzneria buriramensis]|uniref:Large ribosomal subunit protein bL28 n=1 Tax=Kutzneria buriramensis TaxID=1045776 RepID=A0A3E0HBC6_9PSEU|nr:50S ribosomal protein L28 [Kutzneria buriramensis]REH41722.1 large subunit ribosomal protein L28 [Kutzneria buriramensis]
MAKRCQVTGSVPGYGKQVSHSHRRTSRRWEPNLQHRRYWVPSRRRWVTLRLSAKAIKTIDRKGIDAVLAGMGVLARKEF